MATHTPVTFPFNDYEEDELKLLYATNELAHAAEIGDLEYLYLLETRLGGLYYYPDIALSALQAGQFKFWARMLALCRTSCLALDRDYYGLTFFLQPVEDILTVEIDEDLRFNAIKFAVEGFIQQQPSKEDIVLPPNANYNLPPDYQTIWSLGNIRTIPDDIPGRYNIISRSIVRGREKILNYLLEEVGVRCRLRHLQNIAMRFRRDLYELVRNHLRPEITEIPDACQYREPNDADFLYHIVTAAENSYPNDYDAHLAVVDFLNYNPVFIQKLPSAMKLLQECKQLPTWMLDRFLSDFETVDVLIVIDRVLDHFRDECGHDIVTLDISPTPFWYRIYYQYSDDIYVAFTPEDELLNRDEYDYRNDIVYMQDGSKFTRLS